MGRLPRAPRKIGGVPLTSDTLKDLGMAAIDIAMGRHVSPEIAKERLAMCMTCDMFDGKRCNLCGCFMRKKVGLASANCPIHKWKR